MEKNREKSAETSYNWLRLWNEHGFKGLYRKEESGRILKLTKSQFKKLKENMIKKELTSLHEVKHKIKKNLM